MRGSSDFWKTKVHPAFIEVAGLFRTLAVAHNQPVAKRTEAVRTVIVRSSKNRDDLLERYPDLLPGTDWNQVRAAGYRHPSQREKLEQIFDWFFFKRNRIPAWVALAKERDGDLKAHKQVVRARDEFWRLLNGHGSVLPFKVNQPHSDLLELGSSLGLEQLTPEELADCFDEECPCGKVHDPDALKKQRGRVLKDLKAAWNQSMLYASRTPSRERFAVHGAEGLIAKAYALRDGDRYVEISRAGFGLLYVVYEDGIVGYTEEPRDSRWRVFDRLPAAFLLDSLEELFRMFFPYPTRRQSCA